MIGRDASPSPGRLALGGTRNRRQRAGVGTRFGRSITRPSLIPTTDRLMGVRHTGTGKRLSATDSAAHGMHLALPVISAVSIKAREFYRFWAAWWSFSALFAWPLVSSPGAIRRPEFTRFCAMRRMLVSITAILPAERSHRPREAATPSGQW